MKPETFQAFCRLVYDKSGITLKEGKEALVAARVSKRLRALHLHSFEDYLGFLEEDTSGNEIVFLLDAISTNVTSFYRESHHFRLMEKILAGWVHEGQKRFRVWCAASSTGEEPYTLAMTMAEICQSPAIDWKILATDISTKVLELAHAGVYRSEKLDVVPAQLKQKYFDCSRDAAGDKVFHARQILRDHLMFRRLNLRETPFPMKGPMDFIFCRNVMIYFDNAVRQPLIAEFHRLLKRGGILCIGSSESLTGLKTDMQNLGPSVYVKP